MSTELKKSLRPVASFVFNNTATETRKLCLFPGHFMLAKVTSAMAGSSAPYTVTSILSYANPDALCDAGYDCDQVADDFNITSNHNDGHDYDIRITPKSRKTRYRDFLNYIKLSGVRVSKMRITDLVANGNHDIFQTEMEITASSIGSKAGSDFIQLSQHINPSNYLQNFIEIDLEKQNLLLDETTLAFLEVPGKAQFQIDFTLAS
ncbi:MAG: hypothetical protein IIX06_01430 [Bacteroidales bacterium]|nr:hypothetical protein [Bacteroidales bacterium]